MAKKKEKSTLVSWDEVNEALGRIRDIDINVSKAEALMNSHITDIKSAYNEKVSRILEEKAQLEKQVELYTKEHISEFTDRKTKELTYGKVGFRRCSEIITRNMKAILGACKQHNMIDCITVTEKLNKEALEKYSDSALETVGAHRKEREKYFYEVDLEELE